MVAWPRVLLLSSDDAESRGWEELFHEHALLRRVRDLAELETNLREDRYDAMFCGWSFHAGTWHEALEQVKHSCPDMPVVVFSRNADETEWAQVLEAGAFDLLSAPYQKRTVLPVLEQAVTSCEARRYHQHDILLKARAS